MFGGMWVTVSGIRAQSPATNEQPWEEVHICYRVHTEYVLVKSVGRSLVGLITSAGTGEYFPPFQLTCRNCGGGDRGRVALYHPFGEFRRAKIVLSPIGCSRPTTDVALAHATMDFVGLDLTTSDRWH
ncbi:hypothetical protein TNCV_1325621 [Trichonephila clavipes]|nr:hypothetical protein TNCV_1325621 [Trichonephila clavipes]